MFDFARKALKNVQPNLNNGLQEQSFVSLNLTSACDGEKNLICQKGFLIDCLCNFQLGWKFSFLFKKKFRKLSFKLHLAWSNPQCCRDKFDCIWRTKTFIKLGKRSKKVGKTKNVEETQIFRQEGNICTQKKKHNINRNYGEAKSRVTLFMLH